MAVSNISFYGDESGSHGQGAFVLSGYLGSDKAWSKFDDYWHAVLHDTSIGGYEISYFHMRECYKLEGEFSLFTRAQADTKLSAVVDVLRFFLEKDLLREFTSIIGWNIYRSAVTGPLRDTFHNPYQFAFGSIFAEAAKCVAHLREPIYFFLDDQIPDVEHSVAFQFVSAKQTLPDTLGALVEGPTFRSDKLCYPLQAADLIAWLRHRSELDLPEDGGERPELTRLHRANGERGQFTRYREDGLRAFSKQIETRLREKGLVP